MAIQSVPPLSTPTGRRTGGEIVAATLAAHGIDTVFCVPGESFLPILDALHDWRGTIDVITCRHEHGASVMAEAYGKLTGRPGVCLVTRGPGACNAAIGVHTAFQDSTPMLLLVGQVRRAWRGREAFQEVDFARMFAPLAKHAEQVDDPDRLPGGDDRGVSARARRADGPDRPRAPGRRAVGGRRDGARRSAAAGRSAPAGSRADGARCTSMLAAADRPVLLLGGSGWTDDARADILAFVDGPSAADLLRLSAARSVPQRPCLLHRRVGHRRQSGAGQAHRLRPIC